MCGVFLPCSFLDIYYSSLMTAEIITAWAAVGAVIAAVASVVIASKSRNDFRLSLAADLSMKLDDRFNSEEFEEMRSKAATALLSNESLESAEDVFDFFETLGLLLRTKAVTRELAYNFFFHWANLYWAAGKDYIAQRRQASITLWTDFEFLYKELIEIEKKRDRASADISPSAELLRKYLNDEIIEVAR